MRSYLLFRWFFFIGFLLLIYWAQHFWFTRAWRLLEAVTHSGWRSFLRILWFAAIATLLASILDPLVGHFIPRTGPGHWLDSAARLWLIASFVAFLFVNLVSGISWLAKPIAYALPTAQRETFDPARRTFFRYATYLAGAVPFLAATYGFAAGRLRYSVEKVDVPIADLPKELDGLRIVQLSDIHIGEFMPREEVRRAVDIANDLHADLAVLTGDLISDSHDPLDVCVAEISRLKAPLGIWGCNGNHEIYSHAEGRAQELFSQHGMRMLRHENAQLDWHGARFNLIGVDYQRQRLRNGDRVQMLQGVEGLVRRDMPNILLSHNPNSFYRAAEIGIELSLAGHTHGGQVKFEIVDHTWSPARFITSFVAGLFRLPMADSTDSSASNGNSKYAHLYVNRGLGTLGVPVRLGVPPEITLLTLKAA
jgi:predicted MPP superfamily phosphohydrolase